MLLCFEQELILLHTRLFRLLLLQLLGQVLINVAQGIQTIVLFVKVLFVLPVGLVQVVLLRLHFLKPRRELIIPLLNFPYRFLDLQGLPDFRILQLLLHLSMLLLSVLAHLPELLDLSFVVYVFAETFFQLILEIFYITALG